MGNRSVSFILAFILSFSGSLTMAQTEDINNIDAHYETAMLKVERDLLKKKVIELRLRLQVLEDLADPSLMALFREHESQIYAGASYASLFPAAIIWGRRLDGVMRKQDAIGIIIPVLFGASRMTGQRTRDYQLVKEQYENLSKDEKVATYKNLDAQMAEALLRASDINNILGK